MKILFWCPASGFHQFLWSIDSGSTGSNELYESNSARTTYKAKVAFVSGSVE
ncbi:hypothetical protein SBF1_2420018 [Candidatus Desulfosporosinus infrequens]|uniref:Uncharacterized protein n=1 Tax=Candidatus Desulfosporosinus infrequens TaxID=2043169 RepID=A0A2U3KNC5_9FIRM|nr:hypothetical protein SBF1_2420018 [Candidatus Desulfosporosinus infrequens]